MQIFLDTSNMEQINEINALLKELCSSGLDGVTTNPTTMADYAKAAGGHPMDVARGIGDLIGRNVSVETIGAVDYEPEHITEEQLIAEGRIIGEAHGAFVIKLPSVDAGFKAAWQLRSEGYKTNMTLVFSRQQGRMAGRVGAYFVSPFVGRTEGRGEDGHALAAGIAKDLYTNNFGTRLLFASVRRPGHVSDAYDIGAHCVTVPYDVMAAMLNSDGWRERLIEYKKSEKCFAVANPSAPGPKDFSPGDMENDARRALLEEGLRKFSEDARSVSYGQKMFGYRKASAYA